MTCNQQKLGRPTVRLFVFPTLLVFSCHNILHILLYNISSYDSIKSLIMITDIVYIVQRAL